MATDNKQIHSEFYHIALPAFGAVLLFVLSSFFIFLPSFERSLFESKKQMVQELVLSAWNMVEHLDQEAKAGFFSVETAKATAISHLQKMHYGENNKDYFWINDFSPTLIMHPYRQDLVGQDLSNFADPNGTKLFMEFIHQVEKEGEGFVQYMWQWKDDPAHIVPKLSFVKEYQPWGWIIGSGIYLDDLDREIAALTSRLTWISLAVLTLVSIKAAYMIVLGMKNVRLRQEAEDDLINYKNQLEVKVRERTSELEESNSLLRTEIKERTRIQEEKNRLIDELQEKIGEIKTLQGILPLCSFCKKIRNDKGYWEQVDTYLHHHSDLDISHSICPECLSKHYPDLTDD